MSIADLKNQAEIYGAYRDFKNTMNGINNSLASAISQANAIKLMPGYSNASSLENTYLTNCTNWANSSATSLPKES